VLVTAGAGAGGDVVRFVRCTAGIAMSGFARPGSAATVV
jgi:hypothetical protein